NLNERAELCRAQNLTLDHISHAMLGKKCLPDVGLELLDAEREAAVFRLYTEHHGLHFFTLLEDFRRMLDALGPAQVRDVHQTIDAVFGSAESAEGGRGATAEF